MNLVLANWAPTIVTVVAAIFWSGALFKSVKDHDNRLNKHDTRLTALELSDAEAKGWRRGFEARGESKEK